jgi:tetratricopeptide (TPR) repeat protein
MMDMNKLFLFLLTVGLSSTLSAQIDTNGVSVMDKAMIPAKLNSAQRKLDNNNVRGALTEFREVLSIDSLSYMALKSTSECYYRLKKYKIALEYYKKAMATQSFVSPEGYLFYAKCHHRLAELDKAIEYYQKYLKDIAPLSPEYAETRRFIQECKYAKSMMAKPVPVNITNLGKEINSRYEEYAPSVTADGNKLYFTSRRSSTTGGKVDEMGDYKFYEDIFFSQKDANGKWMEAEKVEGKVNTESHDGILSITPDGSGMYVYKNDGKVAGDIFFSLKDLNTGEFGEAVSLTSPINTKNRFESSTSITEDGRFLYFVSERDKGLGRGDIYVSEKVNGNWSEPKNMGNVINTSGDEKFVFIHPNGQIIFFASNGHLSLGGYDIFKSEFVNGSWTPPMNLGYPINTVNEESTLSITRDNKTMFLSAEFDNTLGERDIYSVDISNYAMIGNTEIVNTYTQAWGRIITKRGKPIKGLMVYWMDEYGVEIAKAMTDKNGVAVTQIIADQSYQIEIRDGDKSMQSIYKVMSAGKNRANAEGPDETRTLQIEVP